jgi:hypothetical protein
MKQRSAPFRDAVRAHFCTTETRAREAGAEAIANSPHHHGMLRSGVKECLTNRKID